MIPQFMVHAWTSPGAALGIKEGMWIPAFFSLLFFPLLFFPPAFSQFYFPDFGEKKTTTTWKTSKSGNSYMERDPWEEGIPGLWDCPRLWNPVGFLGRGKSFGCVFFLFWGDELKALGRQGIPGIFGLEPCPWIWDWDKRGRSGICGKTGVGIVGKCGNPEFPPPFLWDSLKNGIFLLALMGFLGSKSHKNFRNVGFGAKLSDFNQDLGIWGFLGKKWGKKGGKKEGKVVSGS